MSRHRNDFRFLQRAASWQSPCPGARSTRLLRMRERLKGKIGIVTGAGSGIGRASAIALAAEGAQVALVGRRKDRLEEVAREIGDRAFAIPVDVSKTGEISGFDDQVVSRFAGLNCLLSNAGVLHVGNAEQITEEQWDDTFNLNVQIEGVIALFFGEL